MRRVLQLINEISIPWMLVFVNALLVVYAVGYWALASAGEAHGLVAADSGAVSFLDSLYFSVVTLTSLGYGDIQPHGLSRLLASTEVIVGLSFFGVMIAKISSVKQDYILRRMYYADLIDRRLEGYAERVEELRKLYRMTSTMLLDGDIDPELTTTFKSDVAETTIFYQIHSLLEEVRNLIVFEVHNGGFFADVSNSYVSRIYASVQSMMHHTITLVEGDPERACRYVLCGNERWVTELVDIAEEMARLGAKGAKNPDITEQCASILELSARVRSEVLPTMAGS